MRKIKIPVLVFTFVATVLLWIPLTDVLALVVAGADDSDFDTSAPIYYWLVKILGAAVFFPMGTLFNWFCDNEGGFSPNRIEAAINGVFWWSVIVGLYFALARLQSRRETGGHSD